MKSIVFFVTAVLLLSLSIPVGAKDSSSAADALYFGLQIHVATRPEVNIERKDLEGNRIKKFRVDLTVDDKGRVKGYAYPNDSIPDLNCFRKAFDKIEFETIEGQIQVDNPATIPVKAKLVWKDGKEGRIDLDFPVWRDSLDELHSDTLLLNEYFRLNKIDPPGLREIPPLSYLLPVKKKDGRYLTITALVSLDDSGKVENIEFPFDTTGQGTHQVFMALLYADYMPVRVDGKAYDSRFYVTFRLFDNIEYPFQPVVDGMFDSTATDAQKCFVTTYWNPQDIAVYPIPRDFPHLSMPLSGLSVRATPGFGWVEVGIDTTGAVVAAWQQNTSSSQAKYIQGIARRLTFYPAYDKSGKSISFSGKVLIQIDKDKNVVYFPEWLR